MSAGQHSVSCGARPHPPPGRVAGRCWVMSRAVQRLGSLCARSAKAYPRSRAPCPGHGRTVWCLALSLWEAVGSGAWLAPRHSLDVRVDAHAVLPVMSPSGAGFGSAMWYRSNRLTRTFPPGAFLVCRTWMPSLLAYRTLMQHTPRNRRAWPRCRRPNGRAARGLAGIRGPSLPWAQVARLRIGEPPLVQRCPPPPPMNALIAVSSRPVRVDEPPPPRPGGWTPPRRSPLSSTRPAVSEWASLSVFLSMPRRPQRMTRHPTAPTPHPLLE